MEVEKEEEGLECDCILRATSDYTNQNNTVRLRAGVNQIIHLHTAVPIDSKPDSLKVYSTPVTR